MAEIVPAILTNDVSDFRKIYAELFPLAHYFKKLHIDFIDGEYLPNKSLMPKDLVFLKTPLELMAHFMTYQPAQYLSEIKELGFKWAIFSYEAFKDDSELEQTLDRANKLWLYTGISLNPETPVSVINRLVKKVNLIQLMGIHPGAQGRTFEEDTISKIKELRMENFKLSISVDGGIKVGNAGRCVKAGAEYLIAGSSIMRSEDKGMAMEMLLADMAG